MSRADLTGLMLDASSKAYLGQDDLLNGYVINLNLSILDTDDGFRVQVYQSEPDETGAKEYIVTFAGTENIQDAYADLQLGWTQWENHREDLINKLLAEEDIEKHTVHFTGHSLGGGLAQYAAYEYTAMYRDSNGQQYPKIKLTTFNALGGVEGLTQHSDDLLDKKPFQKSLLDVVEVEHIIVNGDLVSRFGSGHIGGNTREISLGSALYPALDLIKGHTLETFYDYFSGNNVTATAVFNGAQSTTIDYLDVSEGQRMAAQLARIFNDNEYGNEEASLRLASGILVTLLAGSSSTFETLANAIKENYQAAGTYESLNVGLKTLLFTFSNWTLIQTRIGVSKAGTLALTLEALTVISAATADFIETSQRDELNNLIANLARGRIQDGDIDRIVYGKPGESYLRAALLVSAAMGSTEDGGISAVAQILYGDLSLAGNEQAQNRLAINLLSGENWLADSLEFLADYANQQSGINLVKFSINLSKAILFALDGVEVDSEKNYFSEVNEQIDYFIVSIAKSYANAAPEFVADYTNLELALGDVDLAQTVSLENINDLFIHFDAELAALKDSYPGVKAGIEEARDLIANAWQTVDIELGVNSDQLTGQWTDLADISGNIVAYTLKLQFETSEEGEFIRLELPGGWDSQLRLIGPGIQDYNSIQLPQEGEISLFKDQYFLTLPGGVKEVTLFAVYSGDIDHFPTTGFDLKASLVDANWLQTHQENIATQVHLSADSIPVYEQFVAGTNLDDKQLTGSDLAEEIYGYEGNDNLSGQAGNDHLYGGGGEDILDTGIGDDQAEGGQGRDILGGAGGNDTLRGGSEDDALAGGDGLDFLYGNDGSDVLSGGAGADFLDGGEGDDYIHGDFSILARDRSWSVTNDHKGRVSFNNFIEFETTGYDDLIFGREGRDIIWGDGGNDIIDGGNDNDSVYGGSGFDQIDGSHGDDILHGQEDSDIVNGGAGNDQLWGEEGVDILHGGNDDDILRGDGDHISGELHGSDTLYGDHGNDELIGGGGDDLLFGGVGADQLLGDALGLEAEYHGNDLLEGGKGNDRLWGLGGADILKGGQGDDFLDGDDSSVDIRYQGNDQLFGAAGKDNLFGRGGDDTLDGGTDDDWLQGQQGNDTLRGGQGSDYLWGGEGDDSYDFSVGDGVDMLEDSLGINQITFNTGLNPDLLTAELVNSIDGMSYLELNYGQGDTVYIKDGLQGSIEKFNFGGTSLHYSEMIALSLNASIEYQVTDNSGAVYASRFADTLRGSSNIDELHGQAGDDILAGGAGDDVLEGGAGHDTYILGIGSGSDIIIENSYEINTIRLHKGLIISDLATERRGQDMFLHIQGRQDGVLLSGYYNKQPVWHIETSDGKVSVLSSLLLPDETIATASISEVMANYVLQVDNFYTGALRVNGYQPGIDGLYHKTIQSNRYNLAGETYQNIDHYKTGITLQQEIRDDGISISSSYQSVGGKNYIQSSTLVNTVTQTETTTRLITQAAVYQDKANSEGRYVDFANLGEIPFQTEVDEIAIPVFSKTVTFVDPLTGQVTPLIEGYWIYPAGSVPSYVHSTETVIYKEYEKEGQLLIRDVVSGSNNSDFQVRDYYFNHIDAGAGDDVLNAEPEINIYYLDDPRQGFNFSLPDKNLGKMINAPGSLLYGNDGQDEIRGSLRNDILIGGRDNDQLYGSRGNDTYYLYHGDGHDVIFDQGLSTDIQDIIVLPDNVSAADITVTWGETLMTSDYQESNWPGRVESLHTVMTLSWSSFDSIDIVVPHSMSGTGYGVDQLIFDDGRRMSLPELLAQRHTGKNPGADPHLGDNTLSSDGSLFGGDGDDILMSTLSNTGITNPNHNVGYFDSFNDPWLIGGNGYDHLIGSDNKDQLFGGSILYYNAEEYYDGDTPQALGGLWDAGNVYRGGAGNDTLWLTAGNDTIEFNLGDGVDLATDLLHYHLYLNFAFGQRAYGGLGSAVLNDNYQDWQDPAALESGHLQQLLQGQDTLSFGAGIDPGDIYISRRVDYNQENDLIFSHRNGIDSIIFNNWYSAEINQLNRVEFADGTIWEGDFLQQLINGDVQLPELTSPIADQSTDEDSDFSFNIANSFSDPGDRLTYTALLMNGTVLPNWLSLDSGTGHISGTPGNEQVGQYAIRVNATDTQGATVSDEFVLTVNNTNDMPLLAIPLNDLQAMQGNFFSYILPTDSFIDEDTGDKLAYQAQLSDGRPLPEWLSFDVATMTLSGTPDLVIGGNLDIRIVATDTKGATVSDSFMLTVDVSMQDFFIVGTEKGEKLKGGSAGDNIKGFGGNDRLNGKAGDDVLQGGTGNDVLRGGKGADSLDGGEGSDILYGNKGDDILYGGIGDDFLNGRRGNDRYNIFRGDGHDKIVDNDSTPGNHDVLSFMKDIDHDQLWFSKQDKNLNINVIGTLDQVTIKNWYSGINHQLETIQTADGLSLENNQVDQLVSAMAAFNVPAPGELNLSKEIQEQIEPTLAATWQ